MVRFYSVFLLLILSFSLNFSGPAFSQETPKNMLLSEVLGRLEPAEFIELTPVELAHINAGFCHCINSKLTALTLIDVWDPLPQYQTAIDLLKTKIQELTDGVRVRGDETSAHFMRRLLKMNQIAEEIFSVISRIKFQDQQDALRLQKEAAHISNLLHFSLRVFQKQKASLSLRTLENIEVLGELAKGETIYMHVNHQGELLPSEVISHLDLFMPREEFIARFALFTLLADFVSDPNNQFRPPKISIQDGKFVMNLSYCLTLFGSAKGEPPWHQRGPGLMTHLFKIFYERQLGASIAATQDFHNKLLEIEVRVPLSEPLERHASLAGALSRLETQMYLRRTVTEALQRPGHEPERAMDMNLLVPHLSRWGRQEKAPWSLENVLRVVRYLKESALREAKRAAK